MNAAKAVSKRVNQKLAEATGDLIGNKIFDKITSTVKSKEKTKKVEEIYIPPVKRQQIIDDCKLFSAYFVILLYKNGISRNCRLALHDF